MLNDAIIYVQWKMFNEKLKEPKYFSVLKKFMVLVHSILSET